MTRLSRPSLVTRLEPQLLELTCILEFQRGGSMQQQAMPSLAATASRSSSCFAFKFLAVEVGAESSSDAAVAVMSSLAHFGSLLDWLGAVESCDPLARWTNSSVPCLPKFIFAVAQAVSSACSGVTATSVLRLNAA